MKRDSLEELAVRARKRGHLNNTDLEYLADCVHRFILTRNAGRNLVDMEAATQEALLRLWKRSRRDLPEPSKFRIWVFGQVHDAWVEQVRRTRTDPLRGAVVADDNALAATITSVTQRVARNDDVARFQRFLSTLRDHESELVEMIGFEGRPITEVAEQLGCKTATVQRQWSRVREKLRELGDLAGFAPVVAEKL